MAEYSKQIFINSANIPLKIHWMDDNTGYQEVKLKAVVQESKNLNISDNTLILNSIPPGFHGIWIDIRDQINLNSMSEAEINSIRFVIYYNTDNPVNLMPDINNIKVNYFLGDFGYPESILYIAKKV